MTLVTASPGTRVARPISPWLAFVLRRPAVVVGVLILVCFALVAIASPWLAGDPAKLNPVQRLKPPSAANWFGSDQVGRSVFARTLWGTQVSLLVGLSVAIVTTVLGVAIGVIAGYFRFADTIVMRVMDAVMAIPAILLAIALVALVGASPLVLVIAISVPEIPRMARMVRASVLILRDRPFVEAAITCGGRVHSILLRHILPGAAGPILVQATYVFASAMILEAILSFLGAGTPPDVPSWGNMMAEGRQFLQLAPWVLGFPAICLSLMVLAVNLVGDGLRDMLDPSIARATGSV
jgi:peptide/nickel transport system permease protein